MGARDKQEQPDVQQWWAEEGAAEAEWRAWECYSTRQSEWGRNGWQRSDMVGKMGLVQQRIGQGLTFILQSMEVTGSVSSQTLPL